MIDFVKMDTSIYWNYAKKYIPTNIKTLFIAESTFQHLIIIIPLHIFILMTAQKRIHFILLNC